MDDTLLPLDGARDTGYRVLARKYRPQTFAELIGQEALVRTLTNAIASGRLAHAYILTGVRGVGKTTTARILARALNCTGPDGKGGPTPSPCGACDNCRAISADRHVDVLEMDAASRTGVDDIREILDGVRYGPTSARYKVYIVDEVHMLSRHAFNALLKTLEEPPPHTKFVFATTEIRKVPVTVLSRCQRFDLRRVDAALLARHFASIAEREGATLETEALDLLARAADGSVRDGLSLLDQAIAQGTGGPITAAQIRDMLGLADRSLVLDLFEAAVKGETGRALGVLAELRDAGADAVLVLQDLLDFTHLLTRLRLAPDLARPGLPEAERTRGTDLAAQLSIPVLARAWQMLLKGLAEVQAAPSPDAALEMVIIRLIHAAGLPTPGELLRRLDGGEAAAPAPRPAAMALGTGGGGSLAYARPAEAAPAPAAAPAPSLAVPETFRGLVSLLQEHGDVQLYGHLYCSVHPVRYEPGLLEFRPEPGAPKNLASQVMAQLQTLFGRRWMVGVSGEAGEPTLIEQDRARMQRLHAEAAAHPLVRAALETFPGARIEAVHDHSAGLEPAEPSDDPGEGDG